MLFGFTASKLFEITNITVLPAWLLLVFFPRSRVTSIIVKVILIAHAFLYFTLLMMLFANVKAINTVDDISLVASNLNFDSVKKLMSSFGSLEQIAAGFSNVEAAYLGWVHYLVMDLAVARYIVSDSEGIMTHLLVIPCLFFTLMFGPCGLLLYFIVKFVFSGRRVKIKNE